MSFTQVYGMIKTNAHKNFKITEEDNLGYPRKQTTCIEIKETLHDSNSDGI
jgi:hypothetical protein